MAGSGRRVTPAANSPYAPGIGYVSTRPPQQREGDSDTQGYGDRDRSDAELASHENDGGERQPGAQIVAKLQGAPLLPQLFGIVVVRVRNPRVNGHIGNFGDGRSDQPADKTRGKPPLAETIDREIRNRGNNRQRRDSDGERTAHRRLAQRVQKSLERGFIQVVHHFFAGRRR